MTSNLETYMARINAELPGDLVEAIGLDISGRDGDDRFPYTWASLSDHERLRALSVFPKSPRIDTSVPNPQLDVTPIAQAAQEIADVVYRLGREWDALLDGINDDDQKEAMSRAMEQGFPFGKALEDVSAESADWVEHLNNLVRDIPSVLSLAAAQMGDDVDALAADARKREPGTDPDTFVRGWQNGGLSGVTGRVGGIFTPTVIAALAALMQEIHHSDHSQVKATAADFARVFLAARRASKE